MENQVGICKVKEALDNIRNTVAGHIQIDYRICCAMWNFNMKDSAKIATKIRKRCLKRQNKLESLLEMKFTSTVKSTNRVQSTKILTELFATFFFVIRGSDLVLETKLLKTNLFIENVFNLLILKIK